MAATRSQQGAHQQEESTRSISMKLSVNVKFDMISELHRGLIVHAQSENCNLRSRVVLHTTLTTASIACNRIDRLRCHQKLSIPRKWKKGISSGVVICPNTSTLRSATLNQPHVVNIALIVVKETHPLKKDLLNRPRLKRVLPFIKCFFFNKRTRYLYKNLRIAEWTCRSHYFI